MDMTMTNQLLPLEQRPTELGRIRLGDKSVNARGKEFPVKIDTWRLTSASEAYLQAAAELYGGKVEPWKDAPDEGYFELLTESKTLNVLIPRNLRTLTQWYEWWQGGTCERRCDGQVEQMSMQACLCQAEDGDMKCRPRTRLSIMLPDVPGLGTWRLETDGWNAATSIPATIELLKTLSTKAWIPAVLRLEQRSKKGRDEHGKVVTHRFAVPVLDLPGITVGSVVRRIAAEEEQRPRLEAPQPTTQADRIAAQRAQIEAQTTSGRPGPAPVGPDEELAADRAGDEPPQPAATTSGEETSGRAPSPGQDAGGDSPRPGSDAGARTATPRDTEGDAEAGNPEPASPTPDLEDTATSGSGDQMPPPPPGSSDRCEAFSADHGGRCSRAPGHAGNHVAAEGSWKETTPK